MTNRPDPFRRDKNQPFDELSREDFARARAKGANIKAASVAAGVSPATGAQFERHEAMMERVRELRQGAEAYVGVSKAWVMGQLQINVEAAREDGAYKASNEALSLIYKLLTEDNDVKAGVIPNMPVNSSPREVQRKLRAAFGTPVSLPPVKPPIVETEAEADDGP